MVNPSNTSQLVIGGKYILKFKNIYEGRIYTFENHRHGYGHIFISDRASKDWDLHSAIHFHTEFLNKEHPELGKITQGLFENRCLYIGKEHLHILKYVPEAIDLDEDDDECI